MRRRACLRSATRRTATRKSADALRRALLIAILPALLLLLNAPAACAGWRDHFRDPEDGAFDASAWLLESKGAFPVPFPITEPAIGYGGGLMVAFFQQSLAELAAKQGETGFYRPPNIYAAGGFGTENGTWGALGGGMITFHEDRWRWRGGAAYTNLNLTYYGADDAFAGHGLDYGLTGFAAVNHLLYRLGQTHTWLVACWVFLNIESAFDAANTAIPTLEGERRSSGVGPSIEYDSRDTIFTPGRGWTGSADALFYAPALGGDATFQTYRAHVFAYVPLGTRFVLGTRLDGRSAQGDTPFYMLPFIDMRGIPLQRYQGEHTALVEEELRWNVTRRWALVGFAGAGRAWGSKDDFSAAATRVAGGTGFRYLIARQLRMFTGLDFAWGPDDFAFYIQVGNAWR
jgi:Omp85 superfamily domain